MRISSKARYGLAAMINLAQNYRSGDYITIVSISEKLGISKIYLEQIFSLLKRAGLVNSIKGAQGGYQLSKNPEEITALDVMRSIETSLFEETEQSTADKDNIIEKALESVWEKLDSSVSETLSGITLIDLVREAEKHRGYDDYMYYI
jgi:Rrf2 family protein